MMGVWQLVSTSLQLCFTAAEVFALDDLRETSHNDFNPFVIPSKIADIIRIPNGAIKTAKQGKRENSKKIRRSGSGKFPTQEEREIRKRVQDRVANGREREKSVALAIYSEWLSRDKYGEQLME